jgi:beta-lactam-binding protein with PASTA domain
MAERLRAHLPRLAVLVLVGLAMTATLTYAASRTGSSTPATTTTAAPKPPLTVPSVTGEAFVFAKGALEDAGFSWRVVGSVQGYAANTVVSQSPDAGTRVLDNGAPLITLTLKRNPAYPQDGQAEDASPYQSSSLQPADLAAAVGPEHPATTAVAATPTATTAPPATTTTAAETTAKPTVAAKLTWPQNRPPAFTVPGARKEPLDEMPLTNRAQLLLTWLGSHPRKTTVNVKRWLYQNEWVVTGAKLGWWHGADALTTLIAADRRAQKIWGIGSKSASVAVSALTEVRSRSK